MVNRIKTNLITKKYNYLIAVFFCIIIFGEAYILSTYNVDVKLYGLLVFAFLSSFRLKHIVSEKHYYNLLITSSLLLMISFPFWDSMYNAYSYGGIIIAVLVYKTIRKETLIIIKYIFYISIVLAVYEYFTGQYIFNSTLLNTLGKDSITLDTKMSGGLTGVFRSKAIFFGPLSLGVFLIIYSLIQKNNINVLLLSFLGAFLASSRLAQLIIMILIGNYFVSKRINIFKIGLLVSFIILTINSFEFGIYDTFRVSIERGLDTFNLASSSHVARIQYWLYALKHYFDYPFVHLIFGNNGSYFFTYSNNAESGWLSLLVDNGILGFLFYFYYIISLLKTKGQKKNLLIIIIIFFCMSTITFHLSSTNNLMFWILLFELRTQNKIKQVKIEKL